MTSLSLARPALERCERPTSASLSASRLQPGRFGQGPEEKWGDCGRWAGLSMTNFDHFYSKGAKSKTSIDD